MFYLVDVFTSTNGIQVLGRRRQRWTFPTDDMGTTRNGWKGWYGWYPRYFKCRSFSNKNSMRRTCLKFSFRIGFSRIERFFMSGRQNPSLILLRAGGLSYYGKIIFVVFNSLSELVAPVLSICHPLTGLELGHRLTGVVCI